MKTKAITTIMLTLLIVSLLSTTVTSVLAVKPLGNLASATKVLWNLSADVMPVPPYGSRDISGSDTASKLIVNQPNGNVEVVVTGAMNGLNPTTLYTVYLSKDYTPYVLGWNVEGIYILHLALGGGYDHDIEIEVQTDGTFSGTGGYPASGTPPYSFPYNEVITGTIDVMTGEISIHSVYENGYWYTARGTIAPDGTMSGTLIASNIVEPGAPWYMLSGKATGPYTGDTSWPGLFTVTVQPFTFTTDEDGSGSWHLNLRDSDFSGSGIYTLSVWINEAGLTMLISDNFVVTVD